MRIFISSFCFIFSFQIGATCKGDLNGIAHQSSEAIISQRDGQIKEFVSKPNTIKWLPKNLANGSMIIEMMNHSPAMKKLMVDILKIAQERLSLSDFLDLNDSSWIYVDLGRVLGNPRNPIQPFLQEAQRIDSIFEMALEFLTKNTSYNGRSSLETLSVVDWIIFEDFWRLFSNYLVKNSDLKSFFANFQNQKPAENAEVSFLLERKLVVVQEVNLKKILPLDFQTLSGGRLSDLYKVANIHWLFLKAENILEQIQQLDRHVNGDPLIYIKNRRKLYGLFDQLIGKLFEIKESLEGYLMAYVDDINLYSEPRSSLQADYILAMISQWLRPFVLRMQITEVTSVSGMEWGQNEVFRIKGTEPLINLTKSLAKQKSADWGAVLQFLKQLDQIPLEQTITQDPVWLSLKIQKLKSNL